MMRAALIVAVLTATPWLSLAGDAAKSEEKMLDEAREVFDLYVSLGRAFDPAVADLYSDDAVIRNKRTYPTGQVRELSFPAPEFKALIREAMPLAKERGDISTPPLTVFNRDVSRTG